MGSIINCKYVLIKTLSLDTQEMLYWFTLLSIKATTESAKLSQKKESWSRLMAGLRCFQRLVVSGGPSYRLAPSIGERLFPSVTSFHVADLQVSRFWQHSLKEWRILTISLDSCHEDWIRDTVITWEPTLLQYHELEMYWEQLESNNHHSIHCLFSRLFYITHWVRIYRGDSPKISLRDFR